jgi:hypothetical protein
MTLRVSGKSTTSPAGLVSSLMNFILIYHIPPEMIPERDLWRAVLLMAISDIVGFSPAVGYSRLIRNDAAKLASVW